MSDIKPCEQGVVGHFLGRAARDVNRTDGITVNAFQSSQIQSMLYSNPFAPSPCFVQHGQVVLIIRLVGLVG